MLATRRKHSASATDEPPNLCTTQAEGSGDDMEKCDLKGQKSPANLLVGPHRAQARAANIWHKLLPLMSLHRLLPLFERARTLDQPLVLATVIRTAGSTYAKPGAQMLIAADGEYAGLLSGGCLEGDLREHAREVAASGAGRIVSYDMRSTTDQLFG